MVTPAKKRDIEIFISPSMPTPQNGSSWTQIPVWVRDGWNTTPKDFVAEATAADMNSPMLHLFLPNQGSDEIRSAIAAMLAADEVLQKTRCPPNHQRAPKRTLRCSRVRKKRARRSMD